MSNSTPHGNDPPRRPGVHGDCEMDSQHDDEYQRKRDVREPEWGDWWAT